MIERNQAARREDTAKEAGLYVAFELSRKKWKLGISDGTTMRARVVSIEARDWKRMKQEVEKARERFGLEKAASVRSCYEAGREGFWIHRALEGMGIENIVIDAASMDVKRRKRAKTDRIDAEGLVRQLIRYWRGERDVWSVVRVPSEEAEDSRQMHREMEVLKRETGTASGTDPVVVVYGRAGRGSELGIDEATGSAVPLGWKAAFGRNEGADRAGI